MLSARTTEAPNPLSVEAMALNLKRSAREEMEDSSDKHEDAQPPKKVFRRAEPVQAVNLTNLVVENLVVSGGIMKYKPSSSTHELHLNLTTMEHKLIVHKATLESDDRSKFVFDVPRGGIVEKLEEFISSVSKTPLVQKRLEAGHRFLTPLRSSMIHATVDYRQNAQKTPSVFRVIQDGNTAITNFEELSAVMYKTEGFCDWEASVQVAASVFFIDKGSEPSVILCFYVTVIHLARSALSRRLVVPQDMLEV